MSVIVQSTAAAAASPHADLVGLRVHTQGEVTTAWLREYVLPAWESATDGGRRLVWLRRGWLGGPHVDIVGVGPSGKGASWAELARSVEAGPRPTTAMDPAEYLERARVRGRLENVSPPYLPLQDHGTTVALTSAALEQGDSALGPLRQVTDAVLAPALVRSVGTVADDPTRLSMVVLEVLTSIAQSHALGAGYGTFSLRSHTEALLANWSPHGELRAEFARRYQAQRDTVVTRLSTLLEGDGGGDITAWRTALAYSRGVIDETVRRGDLTNEMVDAAGAPATGTPPSTGDDNHPDTDFHRAVYSSGALEGAGEWFAGYRFLVNCVYAQLPLLGVSPLQRAYGCWVVAEAVDEVLGESWTDRLRFGADRQEETR